MAKVECSGGCQFESNQAVADKVRDKGFAYTPLQNDYEFACTCGQTIVMNTHVFKCPHCQMTYAVTPCSADDPKNIVQAGINY